MTSPSSTQDGTARFPELQSWTLFCCSVFVLKGLLFAIDPIPKIYMGDSGSYIWTALTGWIPEDRSYFYGFVIRWTSLWTESLTSLLIVQLCLGAITSIMLAWICRSIFKLPRRWSFLLGFLCAADPLQLLWERYVMTETISLCLYALLVLLSFFYLRDRRLQSLVLVQVVSVLLIGFRMSFLLLVQLNTVILPLIAFAPDVFARLRRPLVLSPSRISAARICGGHLLLSLMLMFLLHATYKRVTGWACEREPAYLYRTGLVLLSHWSPIIQPEDSTDSRLGDLIRRGDEFGLKNHDLRNSQLFSPGRLIDTWSKIEPDRPKADSLAKAAALHALWRDPFGVLGIAWRTYSNYWNVTVMKRSAEMDLSFGNPPNDELIARLASRFHLAYARDTITKSAIQSYYVGAWPYYFLILVAPLLSALTIVLKSERPYAVMLFVHISVMMATSMAFGGDNVRYLQPISFMTLLVLALGAKAALRFVRKDKNRAMEDEQQISVQSSATLQSGVIGLAQPASIGS